MISFLSTKTVFKSPSPNYSFRINSRHSSYYTQFFNNRVEITDTTLRDGLQGYPRSLPFKAKINVIKRLAEDANMTSMEIGSIVNTEKFPNMKDTPELIQGLKEIGKKDVNYWVLVPNQKGLEIALKNGAREISLPSSVSETFIKENINCSVEESFKRFGKMIEEGKKTNGVRFRAYLSCSPYCPKEGKMSPEKIADFVQRFYEMKCDEIFPSDTVGKSKPEEISEMLEAIFKRSIPKGILGLHLHGSGTRVSEIVKVALSAGIRRFDSSMGNIGGCPVVKKAEGKVQGNIPTEDIIPWIHQEGYDTGINPMQVLNIRQYIFEELHSSKRH